LGIELKKFQEFENKFKKKLGCHLFSDYFKAKSQLTGYGSY
jgi:hypothetical protein